MADNPTLDDGLLEWPPELAVDAASTTFWSAAPSNLCLDFHGDPATAELVVFSDGNHHMALRESLYAFRQQHRDMAGIFYMTTPPSVVQTMLEQGGVNLGNLRISARPHVIIGPDRFIARLQHSLTFTQSASFMKSRGCALVVARGNPGRIQSVEDLMRRDIRIACSNPQTETASYEVYRTTVMNHLMSGKQEGPDDFFSQQDSRMVFSQNIHHREVPALIASGQADVAVVYYHLALRYARIFPQQLEMLPLTASREEGLDSITEYHVALLPSAGKYGEALYQYLQGAEVRRIYDSHGLG